MADYSKMKVVELKAELKRLGLPQNGLKAELVSRLEEATATASEDDPAATSEPPAEPTTTEPDEAQPAEVQPPKDVEAVREVEDTEAANGARDSPKDASTQETTQEPQDASAATVAQDSSTDDGPAQNTSHVAVSETPSLPVAEVVQDVQKRKRRSTTPPPSEDAVRKRLRPDGSGAAPDTTPGAVSDSHEASKIEIEEADDAPMAGTGADVEQDEDSTEKIPEPSGKDNQSTTYPADRIDEAEDAHTGGDRDAPVEVEDSRLGNPETNTMADDGATRDHGGAYSAGNDAIDQAMRDAKHRSPSPERDIEPSMHPATCALYIKNFMRPLREQAVQDHLLELATPADAPLDPNIIVNFYLDNIRTHAFAVFTSISAASRVRTALHERVWPDETNRRALWIDFIPPERFEDWVDMEQQPRDKGSMPRYEVIYDRDIDGNVTARLEEIDGNPNTRRAPVSPVMHPDRRVSIPTGPSRPSGIENAPTGPRNPYAHNGPAPMYTGRQEPLESGFLKTRATPQVLYRPVSTELAHRRMDRILEAKDPHYNEESGKDYHRYYFERDDVLVNRGPEIFLGIRPPHREKERRENAARGGGMEPPRERNFGDRRGPPLGPPGRRSGGRRNRAPRTHGGVPRGGDRFRPSGSSYDDRSAPDDRHRRDGYGGGSSRRKDNYRY
ncbi:hypothetical protein F5Y01DRAFT_282491 [Xylaria sp. FL0043]|nr:hypothetical protein F5Y01DRAFT_282491 [Xylaria sp. FL0043]